MPLDLTPMWMLLAAVVTLLVVAVVAWNCRREGVEWQHTDHEDVRMLVESSQSMLRQAQDQVERLAAERLTAARMQELVAQMNDNTRAVAALETVVHQLYQSSGPVRRRAAETQVGEEAAGAPGTRIVVVPHGPQAPEEEGFVDERGRPIPAPRGERELAATPPT